MHEPLENEKGAGALTIIDVMADEQDIRADYERKEEVEKLRALVKTLGGRERQIIVMRYGLAGAIHSPSSRWRAALVSAAAMCRALKKRRWRPCAPACRPDQNRKPLCGDFLYIV